MKNFLRLTHRECVRNLDLRVQTILTSGSPWVSRERRREYTQSGLIRNSSILLIMEPLLKSNNKGEEISKEFFLETPLPKK